MSDGGVSPAPSPPSWRGSLKRLGRAAPWLLVLVTAASYSGVLRAGFVWDDDGLVVHNRLTASLTQIPTIFATDMWAGAAGAASKSGYYRPLVMASYALDRAVFGQWTPGFHLHSLVWHLAAVLALYSLMHRALSRPAAVVVAAVFALHPSQSEAVVWIAARNDPMAAALALWSLVAVFPADASRGRLVLGGVLAWAALMSKESAVVLPALLFLLDRVAPGAPGAPGTSARPLRRYLPLMAAVGVGLAQRVAVGVTSAAVPPAAGVELLASQGTRVLAVYGAALTLPWPLTAVRSLEWLSLEPRWRVLGGLATVAALGALPLLLRGQRRRTAIIGVLWIGVTVLPSLMSVAGKGLIGDRYVYLGMVGFGLWLSAVAGRAALPLVAAAALPSLVIVHDRLPDWSSDHNMWQAAVDDTHSPYAQAGLGRAWDRVGRPGRALPLYVAALDQDPPALDACDGLVDAAVSLGRLKLSEQLGRWGLRRGCRKTGSYAGALALSQGWLGQWDRATATLLGAPSDPRGRDQVVRGALLLRASDDVGWRRLLAETGDPLSLQEQVDRLLDSPAAGAETRGLVEPDEHGEASRSNE